MSGECNGCDDPECQQCCEHGDVDDGWCLDCGKYMLEDVMAMAYDRWKDRD